MNDIIHNINLIKKRIENSCNKVGRSPSNVQLMLATKIVNPETVKFAIDHGCVLLGENKVQEGLEKYTALQNEKAEWHFIGHLQSNKIKDVLKFATTIQSVDRMSLVEKLDKELQKQNRFVNILIEVNTSKEESKSGIELENAIQFVKEVSSFSTLKIKGLMTIGALSENSEIVRGCFKQLNQLFQQIKNLNLPNISMETLSMGMSGDLEIAIEEGSTMVRVGSAVFGKRN